MKFCENCGAQLEDNAVFCEECGTKQEAMTQHQTDVSNNTAEQEQVQNNYISSKEAKNKAWLPIVLLIVFSPVILMLIMSAIFWWLPEFIFWIIYIGLQLIALAIMWKKCMWKSWVKIAVVAAYILMYLI